MSLKKIISSIKSKKGIYGVIAMIAIGFLVYFFFLRQALPQEIMVASRGEFLQQVSVSGKVVPAEEVDLSFEQAGIVRGVYGKVGDSVKAGKLIASQDVAQLQAQSQKMQAGIDLEKAKLDQLLAGASLEDIAVTQTVVINAKADVASAEQSLADAKQNLLDTLQDVYTKADDAVRGKADQMFRDPQTTNPQLLLSSVDASLENSVELQRLIIENDIFPDWSLYLSTLSINSDGAQYATTTRQYVNTIKTFLDNIATILNNPNTHYSVNGTSTTIPSTWKTDISTARTNINTALSNISDAQEELKTEESDLKNAQGDLRKAQEELALKKAPARSSDIAIYDAQIKQAEASLQEIYAQIRKRQIMAPITGVITVVNAKVGSIFASGGVAISMISQGEFQIESYVPEIYISLVKVGNEADVTLDSYGSDKIFKATVVSIDPAETIKDGVSTYKIKLQLKESVNEVKAGMTANVIITTQKKSDVISVPQGVIISKNGKKFVKVIVNEEVVEKEVVLGDISSFGQAEIIGGLLDGDRVVID